VGALRETEEVPLSCLIVDDSEEFQASASRLLSAQGMTIVGCASSAAQALRMAESLRPDVALVDVELGDEDGIELAAQLAASAAATPVILISIRDQDEVSELIRGSPARGFLRKDALDASGIVELLG
jgi:two-component system, NarL family, nitrate/nitrite response regulator NarL